MKLKKVLAAFLAIIMIFAAGCAGKNQSSEQPNQNKGIKDGGTIVFAIGSDPNTLNPLYASDRVTMTINNALFSPLFVINGDKYDYFLAESITPSSDYLTYTLKLKNNLKWHDGQPLNADDIVFTMEKILDPNQNSFLRELFVIDGKPVEVKKIDDTTVEFKLPKLTMAFMGSLAQVSPIPKHIFENEASIEKSSKNDAPIGSGPYKFKEMKKGETVTLERFNDYFRGKPHLDTVVYRVIADTNSANAALQNGELGAKYVDAKDVSKFKNDPNFNIVTYNEGMLNGMVFNLNNDVLKNKDVRQAIAYAINKTEVINGAYVSEEYAQKAFSILTPDALYYTDDVNHFDYNVDKAKELLSTAGVKDLKLKLAFINSKKEQEAQALIIQQSLKNVGIELALMPMDRGAFYKKLMDPKNNKDFDLAFNGYVMGPEPDSYKSLFMTGSAYNFSNSSNKEIDELWNKGVVETDNAKRGEIYKQIQQKVAEEMVTYPIAYPKSIVAINKKYGGVEEAKPVPIFMFQDLSKLYITE